MDNIFELQKIIETLKTENESLKSQVEDLNVLNSNLADHNSTIENELDEKLKIIESASKKINNSLVYAKRIQNALLPNSENLHKYFSDYFFLFKSKDIVSGDFYWIKEFNKKIAIAVADCTGHGVPGAFMSLLGISFLNQIVKAEKLNDAAEILNELRTKVKEALNQHDMYTLNQDGMDIAFFIVDFENYTLDFAGANNHLHIIRKNELTKFKGDTMPIGVYLREDKFVNHRIKIQKNDRIYAFTDGYYDQIGGKDGRKIYSKNFTNILLQKNEEPMVIQQKFLEDILYEWINTPNKKERKFSQLDDILILGLKI